MTPEVKNKIEQIRRGNVPERYKRTKAGIVPMEWEEKRIGDVLTQRKTLMCISEDMQLLSFTIEEGVIEPEDKKSNKRDFLIKDMSTKKFALTEVGDIIYNPANLKFGAIHRNNLRKGLVSPIYGIFYGAKNSHFMGQLLRTQRFIDYAKVYTEGTVEKLKTLSADTFLKLKITLPSNEEQEKIVEILSAQDKVIELEQQKIEELKKVKKYFLNKMFPQKGQSVPEIRFKGFMDAWEQRKLSDIADIITGTTPPTKDKDNYDGDRLFVSPADIQGNRCIENTITTLTEKGYALGRELRPGTSLFVSIGSTIGKVAQIKDFGTTNQQINAVVPNDDMDDNFTFTMLENEADKIKKLSAQQAVPIINKTTFGSVEIKCPKKDEQNKIGAYFLSIDNLITLHQRKLEEEKQKKKVLMQLLLTGIVRV